MNSPVLNNVLRAFVFWGAFETVLFGLTVIPNGLPNWVIGAVFGLIVSIFGYLLTLLFLKSDDLALADLGMTFAKGSLARFIGSLIAGTAVMTIILLINFSIVPIELKVNPDFTILKGIVLSCLSFTLLSAMEEIAFRGYFLKKLQQSLGIRSAIYITSICFGLYHGLNFESAIGPATWGLTFGVLALWSRGLAVPIGFHAALNFVPAMLGEKPRYSEPVWMISVSNENGYATLQSIGSVMQALILVAGVVLIEVYIRRQKSKHKQGQSK